MLQILYASIVESIICAIVCTYQNISQAIKVVNRVHGTSRKDPLIDCEKDLTLFKRHYEYWFGIWLGFKYS